MSGWPRRVTWATRLREWWRDRRDRKWVDLQVSEFTRRNFKCPHDDYLCDKYGCPDDPSWRGDRS